MNSTPQASTPPPTGETEQNTDRTPIVEELPKTNPFSGLVGRFTTPQFQRGIKTIIALATVLGLAGGTTYVTLNQLSQPTSTISQASTKTKLEITSPQADQTYAQGQPVSTNIFSDDPAQFTRVEFNLNGNEVCIKKAPPYNCSLDQFLRKGINQLEALGTDQEGNLHVHSITFTVK